jgi:signal transduction histidine kinase
MLDLLARGEYEMQPVKPGTDQFGLVASKVQILGEVLKGRQSEISDLKGNVERILNELEDGVLIFGRDRRLIAAAGSIERFFAQPRTELVGLPVSDVFPPGTTLGLLLAQAIQTARPIRNRRVPIQGKERGSISMALLSVEFLEASGGGMIIRLRDPEATRQIGKHLQTADRLSAISRLTGGVAHEVKNPLNAMLMHVELAKMKLSHGDYDLEPQMDVISSEILRLDRVVKTFLDFTRPVELYAADTNLQSLVQEIADLARPQAAASGIELTLHQSDEPTTVTVDPDLLKQAILNIVVNAIDAMSDSGKPGGILRIETIVKSNSAEIRVSDTGPGIPPELREKIYNLYFTTKERGSGIGLAMTFQIVQLHDGTIEVATEMGKGTSFTIRLPIAMAMG